MRATTLQQNYTISVIVTTALLALNIYEKCITNLAILHFSITNCLDKEAN